MDLIFILFVLLIVLAIMTVVGHVIWVVIREMHQVGIRPGNSDDR